MGIIIWLIVGGIVGWLASLIMKRDAQQGIILNVVVGIVGALLAGWIFGGGINEGLSRDPCGIDLIMPLPAPAKGCVASA